MSQASLQDLLQQYQPKEQSQYVTQEFQDFAYRLAMKLTQPSDRKTIGMLMRLAKKKPRALLEQALSYVDDANAKNKVALFLWKVKEIEKEKKGKDASSV